MAIDKMDQTQKIRKLLQNEEVQVRVQEKIRRAREDAKVTIGRASELFDMRPTKQNRYYQRVAQRKSSS